jgi:alkylated DNA repair protein (DNA oxidative demethylase)
MTETLAEGAVVLRGFARPQDRELLEKIREVTRIAPLRHMVTPGGQRMSVATTNCGALGWLSDRKGYRYGERDRETGLPWPPMPDAFVRVAVSAASAAGFPDFAPDACLINRYVPGARLTLHQDRNERDFRQPIVSVSLGLPAVFLFGGIKRSDKAARIPLEHGDVAVWGGPSRLRFHGVLPLKPGLGGDYRFNLTFRKAG